MKKKNMKKKKRSQQESGLNVADACQAESEPGILYVVGTPIGNMEDITLRAIKTLNKVDLIAAEDTRQTAKLLNRYFIHCPMISYHDRNKNLQVTGLVQKLRQGQSIALVSEAGTPGISDPAYLLVNAALAENIQVVPVPGVSACITALSVTGVATDRYTFYGFLPRKIKARHELIQEIGGRNETAVIFESPQRLIRTLADIASLLPGHDLVVCHEMTKIHERFVSGVATLVYETERTRPGRGEVTILINKRKTMRDGTGEENI